MAVYFISADLEGIADVTSWCETEPGGQGYEEARVQMTREVAAACEAIRAGVAAALTRPLPVRAVPETLTVEAVLTGHQAARRVQALTALARSPFTRTAVDAVSYTAHSPTELNEAVEEIIG